MDIGPKPLLLPLAQWLSLAAVMVAVQALVLTVSLRLRGGRLIRTGAALLLTDIGLLLGLRAIAGHMGAMDYSETFFRWRWWFLALVLVLAGLPIPLWTLSIRLTAHVQHDRGSDIPAFSPAFRTALLLWVSSGLIVLGMGGSFTYLPRPARLVTYEVSLPDLPAEFDGLRIAVLADHHVGPLMTPARARRRLQSLRRARADLIVDLGDITEQDPSYQPEAARIVGEQTAPLGTFAVAGNFDVQSGTDSLRQELSGKVTFLENEAIRLERNGAELWLVGLGDVWTGQGDLDKALANVPKGAPVILLSHSPDILDQAIERRIPLVLSGHLHGGQVVIPFAGPVVGMSKFGTRFAWGHHQIGPTHLIVSRGLGEEAVPLRLFCPPEILVVILRSPR
jgi:predicted MPP superfamily phosphohydrolase